MVFYRMSYNRRHKALNRNDNIHNNLVIENEQLHQDVSELNEALQLHHNLKLADQKTVQGQLRNEIGGARWQYGGTGKLTTYKTGTDLDRSSSSTSPQINMSRPTSASLKKPKIKTIEDLEKLKLEIDKQRAMLEEKYQLSEKIQKDIRKDAKSRQKKKMMTSSSGLSRPSSSKNQNAIKSKVGSFSNQDTDDESLFNTDYLEIDDKKDRVLEKLSAKVIHRSLKYSENQVKERKHAKKPEIGFGSRIDKKPEKPKPIKNSKLRIFRRAEPATVINDLEKFDPNLDYVSKNEDALRADDLNEATALIVDKDILSSQKYLSEPQEEVLGLNRTLSRIKADQEREDENRQHQINNEQEVISSTGSAVNNVYDEKKLSELLQDDSLQLNLDFIHRVSDKFNFSDSCDSEDDFENVDPQSGVSSANSKNHTPGHSVSGQNVNKPTNVSTSDYSSDIELLPESSSQHMDNLPLLKTPNDKTPLEAFSQITESLHSPKLSAKISKSDTSDEIINEQPTSLTKKNSKKSSVVKTDRFVKAWLRNLGIEDVQKNALIFAKNNVGMAVMKFLTEDQVLEMNFSSASVTNKILHGVQTLKLTPSLKSLIQHNLDSEDHKAPTETLKYQPNSAKRQSRREKVQNGEDSSLLKCDVKNKTVHTRHRSTSKNGQKNETDDKKGKTTQPVLRARSNSRSREVVQKKAEAGVAAAVRRKTEKEKEEKRRLKEKEKILQKQKHHRDMLAAKHQEREEQKTVTLPSVESDIFLIDDDEEDDDEVTGRSTALDKYITCLSSRTTTPHTATQTTDTSQSDISPEQVRSMIQSLLSSDHLQENMTLTLVKNLQKQLEDVENQIKQKQQNSPVDSSPDDSQRTPIPATPVDDIFRCDSEIGIWDPSQAPNILSEIIPSIDGSKKTATIADESKSSVTSEANRSKTSSGRGSVASMSMSKRALLDEIRKEKDEHRKQIKHLQSELTRLQHKDPVKKSEIPQEDIVYKESDLLGEGAFSMVYRGTYQAAEVAVKRLKVPLTSQDKNYFAAEVSLLRDLRHPRVVMLLGVCTETKYPLMLLEYMANGNLFSILHDQNRSPLDHVEFYQIARDITAGMVYLHNYRPPVLHLDLKSMNVLIGAGNRAKIADFGFSKLKHDSDLKTPKQNKEIQGSPAWMAPELLFNGEITVKADVYSFGIILWEMLTRKHPYEACSMFQILERVRLNKRPEIPDFCPNELKELMEKCWHQKPSQRPIFRDILKTMENLSFPSEWRALFEEAGIPSIALNDIQSTRNIISLVHSTLESGNLQTLVQQYTDSISKEETSSITSISEDSLEDELESVSSEDSFDKIEIETEYGKMDSNISSKSQNELNNVDSKVSKSVDTKSEIGNQTDKTYSCDPQEAEKRSKAVDAQMHPDKNPPKASPRKSISKLKVESTSNKIINSDTDVQKSKEAWSMRDELEIPAHSQQVPSAPPPPPPPLFLPGASISRNPQPLVIKDLRKEVGKRKDKKLKSPRKGKPTPAKRFEVNVSALKDQRKALKPVSHTSQLQHLPRVPKEAISSIAEILKKAMAERRFAIGEVGASNDPTDWSFNSEMSN
ncbi:uncharacterized protein LOC126830804 [Patella vulgata]|uniref:uncharacterized protein LOC126830804 n=1 Tax=Patella vulgata TaxID=6465 RepID=UPI00217F4E13|nr:uncharacterized protein LOC126830804 [Patella vulgata]